MSDYTPTTEEVRWQFSTDSPSEFMPEQFDRWLAEIKNSAYIEGWNDSTKTETPRILISANDYEQLRKAIQK